MHKTDIKTDVKTDVKTGRKTDIKTGRKTDKEKNTGRKKDKTIYFSFNLSGQLNAFKSRKILFCISLYFGSLKIN
jgi:hypothetical protein